MRNLNMDRKRGLKDEIGRDVEVGWVKCMGLTEGRFNYGNRK